MYGKIFTTLALAATALAQDFSITTPPSAVQCQPALLSFTGGTQPYFLAAIPAGQPAAPAIADIANGIDSSSYTWNVNLPAGLAISLRLTDSTGAIAYSSEINIQAGPSDSCLNASASTSGLSTAPITTTITSATTASGSVTGTQTSTTNSPSSAPASSTSGTGSATSSPSNSPTGSGSGASASPTSGALPITAAGVPAVLLAAAGALFSLF